MALQSTWYDTFLPEDIVSIIERDLKVLDTNLEESRVGGGEGGVVEEKIRDAKNTWVPDNHWVAGFIWHYICKANRENFLYDISNIQGSAMQYTVYGEGQFYNWHQDLGISGFYKPNTLPGQSPDPNENAMDFITRETEHIRKLSFSLQLSDAEDYEGGQFQLLDETGKIYTAPKKRGCLIIFDARTNHRVRKVTKGTRKSLVGWIVGPRWK